MEEPLGTQEAQVSLMAAYTTPTGNAWYIIENVEDKFDWNQNGRVSYTYYSFTGIRVGRLSVLSRLVHVHFKCSAATLQLCKTNK